MTCHISSLNKLSSSALQPSSPGALPRLRLVAERSCSGVRLGGVTGNRVFGFLNRIAHGNRFLSQPPVCSLVMFHVVSPSLKSGVVIFMIEPFQKRFKMPKVSLYTPIRVVHRTPSDFIPENSAFSDILHVLILDSLGFPQPSNQSAQNSLAVGSHSSSRMSFHVFFLFERDLRGLSFPQ